MDVMTKEQRSRNMQRIKGKDTKPERKLRLALWHAGIRYRKNYGNEYIIWNLNMHLFS